MVPGTMQFVFATLTILFWPLAGHSFGAVSAKIAGVAGIICGAAAVYASAAIVLNAMYGKWALPIGLPSK